MESAHYADGDGVETADGDLPARGPLWRRSLGLVRRIGYDEEAGQLGDFTTTWRVIPLSALAIVIGVLSAFIALALLRLIALFTNLFFYQRLSFAAATPAEHHLGPLVVAVPVIG